MQQLKVLAGGREFEVAVPDNHDVIAIADGLAGKQTSSTEAGDWLRAYKPWLPIREGIGSHGRVNRDAITAIWIVEGS